MKKILFAFAVLATLAFTAGFMSSCEEVETSTYIFHVKVSFFDNMDILASAIDEGFRKDGFTNVSTHYWQLVGVKSELNKKAKATFQNRCKEIDKDRSQLALPLALKGVTIKLIYDAYDDKNAVLDSYTFVEEDL